MQKSIAQMLSPVSTSILLEKLRSQYDTRTTSPEEEATPFPLASLLLLVTKAGYKRLLPGDDDARLLCDWLAPIALPEYTEQELSFPMSNLLVTSESREVGRLVIGFPEKCNDWNKLRLAQRTVVRCLATEVIGKWKQ